MPLTAGEKLGPYEILAMIGKGGMGEVPASFVANRRYQILMGKNSFRVETAYSNFKRFDVESTITVSDPATSSQGGKR